MKIGLVCVSHSCQISRSNNGVATSKQWRDAVTFFAALTRHPFYVVILAVYVARDPVASSMRTRFPSLAWRLSDRVAAHTALSVEHMTHGNALDLT